MVSVLNTDGELIFNLVQEMVDQFKKINYFELTVRLPWKGRNELDKIWTTEKDQSRE